MQGNKMGMKKKILAATGRSKLSCKTWGERNKNKNKGRIQHLQWLALTWVFLGAAVVGFFCLWTLFLLGFLVSLSLSVFVAPELPQSASSATALHCWRTGFGLVEGHLLLIKTHQSPTGTRIKLELINLYHLVRGWQNWQLNITDSFHTAQSSPICIIMKTQ